MLLNLIQKKTDFNNPFCNPADILARHTPALQRGR